MHCCSFRVRVRVRVSSNVRVQVCKVRHRAEGATFHMTREP